MPFPSLFRRFSISVHVLSFTARSTHSYKTLALIIIMHRDVTRVIDGAARMLDCRSNIPINLFKIFLSKNTSIKATSIKS